MEALQQTHYTLDSTSNGPPRGWLNLRTRGLPFSQWTRQFFFIQGLGFKTTKFISKIYKIKFELKFGQSDLKKT